MVLQFVASWRLSRSRRAAADAGATLGGLLATWVTFTPAFSGSSWRAFVETMRGNKGLAAR